MQQENKDGTTGLLQPKNEGNQLDQGEEDTYLNSLLTKLLQPKNENCIIKQQVEIKQEIDSNSEHLQIVEIVKQSQDQPKDAAASEQFEKEGSGNNDNGQSTEKTNNPEQPKEYENVIINETKKIITQESEKIVTDEPEKIINSEFQVIINNNQSIQMTDPINSNTEQLDVGSEINPNLQQSQENEENIPSKQIEEETNCILPQSTQQELGIQQDQITKELNVEQPETQKQIADNPDQSREDSDCIAESDLEVILDNNSEFEIIDIADYDPEFPTEVIEENRSSVEKDVEETTNLAAKKTTDKPKTDKPKTDKPKTDKPKPDKPKTDKPKTDKPNTDKFKGKKKLTDSEKAKFMKNLERQIMQNKVNPNSLPPRVWKTLKLLSGAQRKRFLRSIKEKFAKKQLSGQTSSNRPPQMQGETGPFNEMVRQGVINDLTNSLSHWLSEHWGAAMEPNTGGNIAMGRSTSNGPKNGKPFTEAQKRRFMSNLEKMIERDMVDIYNLPPRIWNSMKQLRVTERERFLKAMKQKFANKSGTGQTTATFESSVLPSSTTRKRNFTQSANLPSHSQTSTAWNKYKGKNKSGNLSSFSFDRDFQNQKSNEGDTANIATTSKVSPNIFTQFFQDGYSHSQSPGKTTMDRNTFANYTESPYHSFSDSFRTPSREDAAFRGSSNLFSYDNKGFTEGANRPSYQDHSNYQSQSYNSSCYTDGGFNFQLRDSGNPSRTMVKSPYSSRQSSELRTQARFSQEAANSSRAMYGSTRDTLKRKPSGNVTSYNHPQPKRSKATTNDNSIRTVITDDSNPQGTINEEQASLLTAELVHLLDKAASASQGHIPRFYNSGLTQGLFRITCADQTSFDWLKQMVSNLPQLWTGAKLHVGNFTKFSSKRVQITVFIPGPLEDSAIVLSRLERQNPGLNTGNWKVSRRTENTRGQVLFLEIDEVSVGVLQKMGFKAFLGLSCIAFQKPEKTPKKRKGKY